MAAFQKSSFSLNVTLLGVYYTGDRGLGHLHPRVLVHFQLNPVIHDSGNGSKYTTGGDYPFAALQGRHQILVAFLLFSGGHDNQEIKNNENNNKWDQCTEHAGLRGPSAGLTE
jgi:hypothetical protein